MTFHRMTLLFAAVILVLLLAGCSQQEVESPMPSYETLYINGLTKGSAGEFSDAQNHFEAALKVAPLYTPAEGCLGIARDAAEGELDAKAAIAIFKGIQFGNHFDNIQKIREINLAISINPNYAPAYNERGIAFYEMEKYGESLSDRNRAIALAPDFAPSYFNKAITCEKLGQYEVALLAYNGFIERAPEHFQAHIDFALFRVTELQKMLAEQNVEQKS